MPASRRPKSTHSRFARWLKIGIDISGQTSKAFDAVTSRPWDYAITVCDIANERCPKFPERTRRVHWGIKDPALAVGTEEERMAAFRSARHELDEWIQVWLDEQAAAQRERRALWSRLAVLVPAMVLAALAGWFVGPAVALLAAAIMLMTWLMRVLWK